MTSTDELVSSADGYGRGWRSLMRDPEICPRSKALYVLLEDYCSPGSAVPFPSRETLAGHLGCSLATLDRAADQLEEHGWIRRERRAWKSSRWHVLCPHQRGHTDPGNGSMSSQVMTDMSSPVRNEAEPIEAKENASVLAETPGGVTESGSEKGDDPVIDGLVADFVAMRFAVTGKQPRVKKNWHRDMRLLVERGDSNYEPEKLDPMKVSRLIQWLGANPSWPETDPKFAWAEVIQSPAGLRNKWEKVRRPAAAEVKRREGSSSPAHRVGPEVNLDYSTGVGVPVSEMDEEDLMISPLMA